MIVLRIDVSKIDKKRIYKGQKGSYLELVVMENKNGEDQYGNTHMVVEGVTKEEREKGIRGTILGNGKEIGGGGGRSHQQRGNSGQGQQRQQRQQYQQPQEDDDDGGIPF